MRESANENWVYQESESYIELGNGEPMSLECFWGAAAAAHSFPERAGVREVSFRPGRTASQVRAVGYILYVYNTRKCQLSLPHSVTLVCRRRCRRRSSPFRLTSTRTRIEQTAAAPPVTAGRCALSGYFRNSLTCMLYTIKG